MNYILSILNFIEDILKSITSIFKIMSRSQINISNQIKNIGSWKTIIIMGNGPSLKDSIREQMTVLKESDCMCVNAFVLSDVYEDIKPKYYLMADPGLWIKNPLPNTLDYRTNIFKSLNTKTKWNLILLVPKEFKENKSGIDILNRNNRITIVYFNKTTVDGFKKFRNKCYHLQFGMPRPQNVLIPCLTLSVFMNYQKIYLIGADHSWHETLFIDDDNNVCIKHKHFYIFNKKHIDYRIVKDIFTGKKVKLHEQFESFAITFKNYFMIEEFARYKKVKILNASKKSYIDAFERTKTLS